MIADSELQAAIPAPCKQSLSFACSNFFTSSIKKKEKENSGHRSNRSGWWDFNCRVIFCRMLLSYIASILFTHVKITRQWNWVYRPGLPVPGAQSSQTKGLGVWGSRDSRARPTPRFTDFFTDFEKKPDCFAVYYIKTVSARWRRSYENIGNCK